jgi:GNAT superfamily N-acetyltransferase
MRIIVRPARAGDGGDLARCWTDSGRYYQALDPASFQVPEADGLAAWFEALLAAPRPEAIWLVAEVDGRVVGSVAARLEQPVEDASRQVVRDLGLRRVFVEALEVEEASRRRGVGARLMEEVEAWGRDQGAVLITLDTYADSPLSIPFYERRMGYRRRSVVFQKRL